MPSRVILGLLLMLLCTIPAAAGPPGRGELGLDFGVTGIDSDLGGRSGLRLSFRGGYHFNRRFELEGRIGNATHSQTGSWVRSWDVDTYLVTALVSGVLSFPSKADRFVPYLQAGIGRAFLDLGLFRPDDSGDAYEVAAGGRVYFGEARRNAFRFEVSRLVADLFGVDGEFDSLAFGFCWRVGDGGS